MARKTEAYVDTSGFIAFLDRSDSYHTPFRRLFSAPPPLITSSLVIAEAHGWFLRRYDQQRAIQFLAFIGELSPLTIYPFASKDLTGVAALLKKFADHPLTLADLHGLMLMREHSISSCWSTDRHLSLMGASLVV